MSWFFSGTNISLPPPVLPSWLVAEGIPLTPLVRDKWPQVTSAGLGGGRRRWTEDDVQVESAAGTARPSLHPQWPPPSFSLCRSPFSHRSPLSHRSPSSRGAEPDMQFFPKRPPEAASGHPGNAGGWERIKVRPCPTKPADDTAARLCGSGSSMALPWVRSLLKQRRPRLHHPGTSPKPFRDGAECSGVARGQREAEKTHGGNKGPMPGWDHPALAFSKGCFDQTTQPEGAETPQWDKAMGRSPPALTRLFPNVLKLSQAPGLALPLRNPGIYGVYPPLQPYSCLSHPVSPGFV